MPAGELALTFFKVHSEDAFKSRRKNKLKKVHAHGLFVESHEVEYKSYKL